MELHGLVAAPDSPSAVIAHIHGKSGNFYSNPFVAQMCAAFPLSGFAFVSMNTRGHDVVAEARLKDQVVYIGGGLEDPVEADLDLAALVCLISNQWPDIPVYLQGHSFGCNKVVHYVGGLNESRIAGAILLSPADDNELIGLWQAQHSVEPRGEDSAAITLRTDLVGIVGQYAVPITTGAYEAMVRLGSPFEPFRIPSLPALPTLAVIARDDAMFSGENRNAWRNASNRELMVHEIHAGGHQFRGSESELIETVAAWVGDSSRER